MKRLLFFLLLLSGMAAAQCPATGWCKTMSASDPATRWADRVWNKLVFDSGNREFHAWFSAADAPVTFSNAIGHYSILSSPGTVTANKWTLDTWCGDTNSNGYNTRQESMHLNADLGTGSAPFTLQIGITSADTGAIGQKPIPQSGHVYVGDEMFTYDSCTSADGAGTCLVGEHGPISLHVTARAQRSNAGWLASAASHLVSAGEETSFACPGPFGIGNDHPVGQHPTGNLVYDSARGRLWSNNGYQENWRLRDTWYRCVYGTASCPDLTQGWIKVPTAAAPGSADQEDVTVYLPDADALLHFGGSIGGSPVNALWVFCLSANATWVDATHTCASSGYLNTWRQVSPHGGSALAIQAVRGTYDTVNHKALFFSGSVGATNSTLYNLVQVYDPASGDWCLSDRSRGGSNGPSCPAGFASAAANAPPGQRFPMWTFDKRNGKGAYLCCAGGPYGRVYEYDAAANTWGYTDVDTTNAPVIDATTLMGNDWGYADESSPGAGDDVFVALVPLITSNQFVEMYQLPAASLGGTAPSSNTNYSGMKLEGVQIQ